ncbi:CHAP domain-containing protein [Denitrobaculum tricleocarpae]|nr:CHAP domain-containing protein [Denitrobaculum tricleocarpae]
MDDADWLSTAGQDPEAVERPYFSVFSPESDVPARKPEALRPRIVNASFAIPKPRMKPAIHTGKRSLQCVPYAREVSSIGIRGDAWTWWRSAKGRYARGHTPEVGAVLVLSKTKRLRYGHLAVVAEVLNDREVLVHQANWLNRGRIHRYTPVVDVSPNNDWSSVRVWYTPGQKYGKRAYKVSGFIYPDTLEAKR